MAAGWAGRWPLGGVHGRRARPRRPARASAGPTENCQGRAGPRHHAGPPSGAQLRRLPWVSSAPCRGLPARWPGAAAVPRLACARPGPPGRPQPRRAPRVGAQAGAAARGARLAWRAPPPADPSDPPARSHATQPLRRPSPAAAQVWGGVQRRGRDRRGAVHAALRPARRELRGACPRCSYSMVLPCARAPAAAAVRRLPAADRSGAAGGRPALLQRVRLRPTAQRGCSDGCPAPLTTPLQPCSATDHTGHHRARHSPTHACPPRAPNARRPTPPPTTPSTARARSGAPPPATARTACRSRCARVAAQPRPFVRCIGGRRGGGRRRARARMRRRLAPAASPRPPPAAAPLPPSTRQGKDTCWPVRTPVRYYLSAYGKVRACCCLGNSGSCSGGCWHEAMAAQAPQASRRRLRRLRGGSGDAGGAVSPHRCLPPGQRAWRMGAAMPHARHPPHAPCLIVPRPPQVEGPGEADTMHETRQLASAAAPPAPCPLLRSRSRARRG